MHIDPWTFALQTINVLILVWLLKRFLYRPVMAALAARQQAADALLAQAQAEKAAAAAETAALRTQSESFAADAERRRADMQAAVEKERAGLMAEASAAAAETARHAAVALAATQARLTAELEEKAGMLAGRMAETLLRRLPAQQTTDAMFQALIERLRTLPEDERRKLADHAPLRLITAAPLDDPMRTRYRQALAAVLPFALEPDFTVDPSLIAGFEVEGAHVRIRNSWRGDLDEFQTALRQDRHDDHG